MKLNATVIFVKDINVSKKFYINILQQQIEHDFGNNIILKSGIALWQINPNHIICQSLPIQKESTKFELYFESEDISKLFDLLTVNKVNFFHPIIEESWGQRTLRFFDPDHHLIEIGEPLHIFVRKLSDSGMSITEIETKTGINIQQIKTLLNI